MSDLRKRLIRLAHNNPGKVQDALLPLLTKQAADPEATFDGLVKALMKRGMFRRSHSDRGQNKTISLGFKSRNGLTTIDLHLLRDLGALWVNMRRVEEGRYVEGKLRLSKPVGTPRKVLNQINKFFVKNDFLGVPTVRQKPVEKTNVRKPGPDRNDGKPYGQQNRPYGRST
jgi:hypothetical protein